MIPPDSDDLDEFGLGYEGRGAPVPSPSPAPKEEELFESLRSMQDGQVADLANLRGKLGQSARGRLNQHAPDIKNLRSPYHDSTQIGITCSGTFTPSDWAGGARPQITGVARTYQSFKPQKLILTETLIVTFTSGGKTETVAVDVADASDLVLTQLFFGNMACLPNAPGHGVSGRTFSPYSLGAGISYPTVHMGLDIAAYFSIEESALYRATPPAGFTTADISSIKATINLGLFGPALR